MYLVRSARLGLLLRARLLISQVTPRKLVGRKAPGRARDRRHLTVSPVGALFSRAALATGAHSGSSRVQDLLT
jgi:hypothetical protein